MLVPTSGLARWRYFMREAQISVDHANASPTRALKRMWLAQASSELERAHAAYVEACHA